MNSQATVQTLPIFVYGTLMIGQPNDIYWQNCVKSFERAHINDCRLFDVGYYPMMIKGEGGDVFGQLVHLENKCYSQILQDLDFLEGYDSDHPEDSNYLRIRVQVVSNGEDELEAWTYVGVESKVQNLTLIEHGDWAKHIAEKAGIIADWWKGIPTTWVDPCRSNDMKS
jgi:gamma-glutamylcyclotransferase (GGCT)/AIG2-like uncharacterized protein YtfP